MKFKIRIQQRFVGEFIIQKIYILLKLFIKGRKKKPKTYCKCARCHVNGGCYSSFPCLKRSYTPIFYLSCTPSNFLSLSVLYSASNVPKATEDRHSHYRFRYFCFDTVVTIAIAMA